MKSAHPPELIMQINKCGWLVDPPLVCAHGGDTTNAFPNTIAAYRAALQSGVDCIEIDVSCSSDGVLYAIHDRCDFYLSMNRWTHNAQLIGLNRDLQRISGNHTARVGFLSTQEINELNQSPEILDDQKAATVEDALMMVSNSVRKVIVDAKVGPPLYEKGLAERIIAAVSGSFNSVQRTRCANCVVWAKSDTLVRDITRLSPDTLVGYIVMNDLSTGARSSLLRIRRASVVGIYHPLVDEKVVQILHGKNKKIYAWTVDDVTSMQNMLAKRVDAIITNNPTMLQQLMEDTRIECLEEGFSLL
ncbi:hypothetical protein Cgig2_025855 [Carnegiea gigantea]|uniref:glycerophosphodiester phosphodiesterase n=1 Tax=Carnegiea gigantea TaxID=171969 RepID=A0A9Q1JT06_9CARY|nr:hypothetical protein Cgig2_025855 [Carnegiea gigantea]